MKVLRKIKRRYVVALASIAAFALSAVPAFATAPTVPTIPVSSYGDSLLTGLSSAVTQIFPYAAAITAFAIGVGMVKRWLGARKATRV